MEDKTLPYIIANYAANFKPTDTHRHWRILLILDLNADGENPAAFLRQSSGSHRLASNASIAPHRDSAI
jgi:hypothetical protein